MSRVEHPFDPLGKADRLRARIAVTDHDHESSVPHIAAGMTQAQAAHREEISVHSYLCWRKECGGLRVDQAKWLKEMEKENARLKKLVAELSLDISMLKDAVRQSPDARRSA